MLTRSDLRGVETPDRATHRSHDLIVPQSTPRGIHRLRPDIDGPQGHKLRGLVHILTRDSQLARLGPKNAREQELRRDAPREDDLLEVEAVLLVLKDQDINLTTLLELAREPGQLKSVLGTGLAEPETTTRAITDIVNVTERSELLEKHELAGLGQLDLGGSRGEGDALKDSCETQHGNAPFKRR